MAGRTFARKQQGPVGGAAADCTHFHPAHRLWCSRALLKSTAQEHRGLRSRLAERAWKPCAQRHAAWEHDAAQHVRLCLCKPNGLYNTGARAVESCDPCNTTASLEGELGQLRSASNKRLSRVRDRRPLFVTGPMHSPKKYARCCHCVTNLPSSAPTDPGSVGPKVPVALKVPLC